MTSVVVNLEVRDKSGRRFSKNQRRKHRFHHFYQKVHMMTDPTNKAMLQENNMARKMFVYKFIYS